METLHLKLSKKDKQTIRDLAKSKRMSMTGYIRNEILNKEWGLPYSMCYTYSDITLYLCCSAFESYPFVFSFRISPVFLFKAKPAAPALGEGCNSQTCDSGVPWVSWDWLLKDDRIVTKPMIAKIEIVMSLKFFIINDLS